MEIFDDAEIGSCGEISGVQDIAEAILGEDEYDGDAISPAEALSLMTTAWQNEISAPTLLPHRYELVDCMVDQLNGMQENLINDTRKNNLRHSIHKMELYRIGFVVNDYIRERLKKIERNPNKCLKDHEMSLKSKNKEILDPREKAFAQRFFNSTVTLMDKCFLGELPPGLRKFPVPKEDDVPKRVFIEVKADNAGEVTVPDMTDPLSELIVNLEQNSTHLMPYRSVSNLVEDNKVLIL